MPKSSLSYSDISQTAGPETKRFAISFAAGALATACVHPIDVMRLHAQLDAEKSGAVRKSMLERAWAIKRTHGVVGWYAGLSAGVFRQLTYGGPRMWVYSSLLERCKGKENTPVAFHTKLALGSFAGGVAAVTGNPAEVALVRMAGDARLPLKSRRNYVGVFDCFRRTIQTEGAFSLMSGVGPTVVRACLLNAGQLGAYSEAKEQIHRTTGCDGVALQAVSSLISSTAAIGLSSPADVIKSRIQMSPTGTYSSVADCALDICKKEGIAGFWKGFLAATMKLNPHTLISFLVLDNLSKFVFGQEAF